MRSQGSSLLVINPHKWLPIYTDEMIQMYSGKRRSDVEPHIYAIADESYRAMLQHRRNQTILITGASGAGKTESAKQVVQYLVTVAGRGSFKDRTLKEQMRQASVLLEAFGNAMTHANANSSRFGQFVRLHFDAAGLVSGVSIEAYLLDKSRVVEQRTGERSFHIFDQVMRELCTFLFAQGPSSGSFWGHS
jgi:myosin heavy subunit